MDFHISVKNKTAIELFIRVIILKIMIYLNKDMYEFADKDCFPISEGFHKAQYSPLMPAKPNVKFSHTYVSTSVLGFRKQIGRSCFLSHRHSFSSRDFSSKVHTLSKPEIKH